MQTDVIPWQVWAFLSALFAALTAVLAKVGVEEINPDLTLSGVGRMSALGH
jgi:transporter family protein